MLVFSGETLFDLGWARLISWCASSIPGARIPHRGEARSRDDSPEHERSQLRVEPEDDA
jgi:hypothetical protein